VAFDGDAQAPGRARYQACDVALGLVELTLFVVVARRAYRALRETHGSSDAFVESMRRAMPMPAPIWALAEKELRFWHGLYRRLVGRGES
jgi:hypothetical protein